VASAARVRSRHELEGAVSASRDESAPLPSLGDVVEVALEVSRFSFVKRRPDGRVHFVSPLPTLFNYGSVPGTRAADGDPLDAVVLGPRRARGTLVRGTLLGVIDFVDHDVADPKLVVGDVLRARDVRALEAFFRVYARAKRMLDPGPGLTRFGGWIVRGPVR
jgi:inorganic pyrophosphatase